MIEVELVQGKAELRSHGEFWVVTEGPHKGLTVLTQDRPLIIGTVQNRHDKMGCDLYIHASKIAVFGPPIFQLTIDLLKNLCEDHPLVPIELRYTGLTEVTLGAVTTLLYYAMDFVVMHYDTTKGEYSPLESEMIDRIVAGRRFTI